MCSLLRQALQKRSTCPGRREIGCRRFSGDCWELCSSQAVAEIAKQVLSQAIAKITKQVLRGLAYTRTRRITTAMVAQLVINDALAAKPRGIAAMAAAWQQMLQDIVSIPKCCGWGSPVGCIPLLIVARRLAVALPDQRFQPAWIGSCCSFDTRAASALIARRAPPSTWHQ